MEIAEKIKVTYREFYVLHYFMKMIEFEINYTCIKI